ncbi:MAG: aminotransferase [Paracoccaceae bacterium]
MNTPVNPNISATAAPPVMEARRWIEGVTHSPDRPLLNLSQAAPMQAPPQAMLAAMAETVLGDTAAHLYGPVLGLPDLRAEVANQWTNAYGGEVSSEQVAITSGCNQAFCAVMTTIARERDEVILPTPWYFNHNMHLSMSGVGTVALATGDTLLPDAERAAALITDRTRAIVLVTPNNPCGVEYPAKLVRAFYDLAKAHDIALIIDETYRDFDSRTGAPHELFARPDWPGTLIQLYSFSKAYRLTGHRVGALIASADRLAQVEKYLDTVTICANQIGQRAALWGMRNLAPWLAQERREILNRRAAIQSGFGRLKDWRLLGLGAFFAYVAHPFDIPSDVLAPRLVREAGVLLMPGTMFKPPGDASAMRELRIAFANTDRGGIETLFSRLENLSL